MTPFDTSAPRFFPLYDRTPLGFAHGGGKRSGGRGCRSSGRRSGEQWRADLYASYGSRRAGESVANGFVSVVEELERLARDVEEAAPSRTF